MTNKPILIKAGDKTVLLNGNPPRVDCRVVAESYYQDMLNHIKNIYDAFYYTDDKIGKQDYIDQMSAVSKAYKFAFGGQEDE